MPESPNPAFVVIDYHSAFGPHKLQLGIADIQNVGDAPDALTATAWDASSRNIKSMVEDLIVEMVGRFPAAASFDSCSVFSQPLPTDLPFFAGAFDVSSIGTAAVPGWSKATQESVNMRDTAGFMVKVVLMDFASGNDFTKYLEPIAIGVNGITAEMFAVTNAWASRAGNKPSTFISRTATLNEKLRRAYRLA